MMRKLGIITVLLLFTFHVKAQFWNEWFRQKSTKRKYLAEQIIALKTYAGYVKKGYNAARSGLDAIKGFTGAESAFHADYFNSLKLVNPEIKRSPAGKSILKCSRAVELHLANIRKIRASHTLLTTEDLGFVSVVVMAIEKENNAILDDTEAIVTSGHMQLNDDERIKRLDLLLQQCLELLDYSAYMETEIRSMARNRQADLLEKRRLEQMYGIGE